MSLARAWQGSDAALARHPNEIDLQRIRRALRDRERYRYVEPRVVAGPEGYRVESPCCSRNVDPDGGVIDIALLRWLEGPGCWWLYFRDHARGEWIADQAATRLSDLLDRLKADPDRIFWQ